MHAIDEKHSNHVKSEKSCDGNRLGRIKIPYFKHVQSKFEIVWCSIHGQASVKHEFCNSLQHFFDLLYIPSFYEEIVS
ncbi:hypothetical protein RO3G_15273 [Rhizopus delemar RA 99-880]|uniref:Uncharacterized protein n=1 Tax=Rhizopus delemar (strain RA 99-880 / ATCC MYA-4621 / FGSC 9543 / NRRL 43880) TaxID=246409 RepID=I1CQ32_RHIO9|nr:hypothetical protein RO3G_15273 [Rhizopus delemar RA 99-880]|eukprot:EIE90562.1 hypothetical protein RO3G_15273 [Rhizopus delemar RA 99-880]